MTKSLSVVTDDKSVVKTNAKEEKLDEEKFHFRMIYLVLILASNEIFANYQTSEKKHSGALFANDLNKAI